MKKFFRQKPSWKAEKFSLQCYDFPLTTVSSYWESVSELVLLFNLKRSQEIGTGRKKSGKIPLHSSDGTRSASSFWLLVVVRTMSITFTDRCCGLASSLRALARPVERHVIKWEKENPASSSKRLSLLTSWRAKASAESEDVGIFSENNVVAHPLDMPFVFKMKLRKKKIWDLHLMTSS